MEWLELDKELTIGALFQGKATRWRTIYAWTVRVKEGKI